MSRGPGLVLLTICLAVSVTAARSLPDTARVVRDVARVFNAPEGREIARLRRGERVVVLGSVDRRRGGVGAVWVRVRSLDGEGHRRWMRARDLRPELAGTARAPLRGRPDPDSGRAVPLWQQEVDSARALADESPAGAEVPIVDMDFECRRSSDGGHLAGCDLITVFEVPPARQSPGDLIARVICEVSIQWTGVSGTEYRQQASDRSRVPTMNRTVRSSMRLHYDFREDAVNALVARQRCGLVQR